MTTMNRQLCPTSAAPRVLRGAAVLSILALAAIPAIAAPDSVAAASDSQPVVRIAGKVVNSARLTSDTGLIQMSEGRNRIEPDQVLDEIILQEVLPILRPDEAKSDPETAKLPGKYGMPAQRNYLRFIYQRSVHEGVKPTDDQIAEWYKANLKNYEVAERVKAHHLFMGVSKDDPSSSPEKVRARLAKVRAMLDDNTTFGALAERFSEAASGARGGEIGSVSRRMPIGPESKPMNIVLEEALFKLNKGDVSGILETSHGLHLMYAAEHETTQTPSIKDLTDRRILPGAVVNSMMTSETERISAKAIARAAGKVVYEAGTELGTTTPCIRFDGRTLTMRDLELLYGPQLTNAFRRSKMMPGGEATLMQRVLDDIGFLRAAEESGVDAKGDAPDSLKFLAARARMADTLNAVIAKDYPTTPDDAKKLYETMKDRYTPTLFEGFVISFKPEVSAKADSAARAKALEEAKAKAEDAAKKLSGGADFSKLAREVSQDNRATSGGFVELVAPNAANDEGARNFVTAVQSVAKDGEISTVTQVGEAWVIAKLGKKQKGDPPPFDRMKDMLLRQAQGENEKRARAELLKLAKEKGLVEFLEGARAFGKEVPEADSKTTESKSAAKKAPKKEAAPE